MKEKKKSKREIKAAAATADRQTAVNRRFIPLGTSVVIFHLFLYDNWLCCAALRQHLS